MSFEVAQVPRKRLAGIAHQGPYQRIGESFMRLAPKAEALGLTRTTDAAFVAVYFDDPEVTDENALRSLAAITVADDAVIGDLIDGQIPPGKYVISRVYGPYSELPDAWRRLNRELVEAGQERRGGVTFEVYFHPGDDPPPEQIRTDVYLPIA
ncbi:MAG: GyrI-like domain-containing protein [Actinobacteria bacterium]|nr:GyrI-like domain-containing protein [Actinomycetota bacterium]